MSQSSVSDKLSQESLLGQILDEVLQRRARGEAPEVEDYARRYPELAAVLRQMQPALEVLHGPAPDLTEAAAGPASVPVPGYLGDYRLVREVGRGGMGVVYEAEQVSLQRQVALKVLPFAAALDAKQLQRFHHEAQAAARLHHTNIVPVYAVGCAHGVHFYAMQFIAGQTLAAVIRELRQIAGLDPAASEPRAEPASAAVQELISGHWAPASPAPAGTPDPIPAAETSVQAAATLSTERPLWGQAFVRTAARLGEQAAEALEHAHQFGIVHRDIKPANLLIDDRGTLWVTDFGLAQFQGKTGLTLTGGRVGTARYMSPEQASDRHPLVDPRTDIYSLGVTLYELLTLHPACTGRDWPEVQRQILLDGPRRPRRLNPAIPRDLETIVLKAMAKEPEQRYATAQEMADDLRRFLDDKPVQARRPTLVQRGAKWARRHKPLVGAAVLLLVLATAGLAVSNVLIRQEQQRTHKMVDLAFTVLDQVYLRLAEKRFPRDPRWEQENGEILQQLLTFFDRLAQENGRDPASRRAAANAYKRVGDIRQELRQVPQAKEAYHQAIARLEQLAQELPRESLYRQELANSYSNLGVLLYHAGQHDEAERAIRQAIQLCRELVSQTPTLPDPQAVWAKNQNTLGLLLKATGRSKEAEQALREAIRLQQQLVASFPAVTAYRSELASFHANLALVLQNTGRIPEAEQAYREAIRLQQQLSADSPTVSDYREGLAGSHNNLGTLLMDTGRGDEAAEAFRQASRLQQQLVDQFPAVPEYRQKLALTHDNLGLLSRATGHVKEAEQAWRQALGLRQQLVESFPAVPQFRAELADTFNNLGVLLKETGRFKEAEQAHRQAVRLDQQLSEDFPAVPDYQAGLATSYHNLGRLLKGAGRLKEAEQAYRQALAIRQHLVDEFPTVPKYRLRLAHTYNNLGLFLSRSQHRKKAEQAYREAIRLQQQLSADFPTVPEYRAGLAGSYNNLGLMLVRTEQLQEAEPLYRQAIQFQQALVENFPNNPEYRGKLAGYQFNLAILLRATKRGEEAERPFRQAIQLQQQLVKDFATMPEFQSDLAATHHQLGLLLQADGRLEEAEQAFREALRLQQQLLDHSPPLPVAPDELKDVLDDLTGLLCSRGRLEEARPLLGRLKRLMEKTVQAKPTDRRALNALAWFLATCPVAQKRDPKRAVALAQKAVQQAPQDGTAWNTLGIAQYYAGNWPAAREALNQSIKLRQAGDSYDWFFLAMAYWQSGDQESARRWYTQAVTWMDQHKPRDEELRRFRAEAAALMDLASEKSAPGKAAPPAP